MNWESERKGLNENKKERVGHRRGWERITKSKLFLKAT